MATTPAIPTPSAPAAGAAAAAGAFYTLLSLYHLWPLHSPLTLYLFDAPFGRFALSSSRWNVNGNIAWAIMEIVAPVTFLCTLASDADADANGTVKDTLSGPLNALTGLTGRSRVLAILYLVHYAHRAVLSPLLLSPRRAPLHLVVPLAAIVFNLLNAHLLARGLVLLPPAEGAQFYLGVAAWAIGFLGNVYHDEVLHDLRRPVGSRLVSGGDTSPRPSSPDSRYKVPYGGLFSLVSFPNYLCEWIEWIGYALAATSTLSISTPSTTPPHSSSSLQLLFSSLSWPPPRLLTPAWTFVLAEISSMLPRAVRGHAWYKRTFEDYPPERAVVVPWVF